MHRNRFFFVLLTVATLELYMECLFNFEQLLIDPTLTKTPILTFLHQNEAFDIEKMININKMKKNKENIQLQSLKSK